MNRSRIQVFLFALAVSVIANSALQSSNAQEAIVAPSSVTTPVQSMDLRSLGLTASVELSRLDCPGYVSFRLMLSGIGTVPADQSLLFRLATHPGGENPPGNRLVVDIPVTIAQGSKTTVVTRYLPKWTIGQCVDITIYEDGRLLEDSLTQFGPTQNLQPLQRKTGNAAVGWGSLTSWNISAAGYAHECRQDWLFIDEQDTVDWSTVPDLRKIISDPDELALSQTSTVPVGLPDDYERTNLSRIYHAVGQGDLPTDWRGYRSYDAIVTSLGSLQRLSNDSRVD